MDAQRQHRTNATKEKMFMTEAAHDARNLRHSGLRLLKKGETIEANFDFQEAHFAESWKDKRELILRHEQHLGGE